MHTTILSLHEGSWGLAAASEQYEGPMAANSNSGCISYELQSLLGAQYWPAVAHAIHCLM